MLFLSVFSFILLFQCSRVFAQDTLPKFTVMDFGYTKIQISWINPFPYLSQVSVQRSYDSIRNFQTIFTSQSPELPQNGFMDITAPGGMKVFYRIFFVKEPGNYAYSKSYAIKTSTRNQAMAILSNAEINLRNKDTKRMNTDLITNVNSTPGAAPSSVSIKKKEPVRYINIYNRNKDSLMFVYEYPDYKRFKDSLIRFTKDTLWALNNYEVLWKRFVPKYVWKPSLYIFTTDNNEIKLELPSVSKHHYRVKFFDNTGYLLFEMKHVKEQELILDKTNFLHAGWYFFDLYEDEQLKEKNKFYLESDF